MGDGWGMRRPDLASSEDIAECCIHVDLDAEHGRAVCGHRGVGVRRLGLVFVVECWTG